tara:strand:+ start:1031 stop:1438 length:408 start_codon:yes stop_codon:yes gene_type:complete
MKDKLELNFFAAQVYTQHLMIEAGIIPYSKYINMFYETNFFKNSENIDDSMNQLTSEEQRVVKRKFRKLWRKIFKSSSKRLKRTLGLSNKQLQSEAKKVYIKNMKPNFNQRELRKLLVALELLVISLEKVGKKEK